MLLKRGSHLWKTGLIFIQKILSPCYWGVQTFEKGVHDLRSGFTLLKKGVHIY